MMDGSVLGLIVPGGPSPLAGLGVDDDAALTPFGGKYRFIDLAFATLANSGVTTLQVASFGTSPALPDRVARLGRAAARSLAPARWSRTAR